jgi:hypothetical protein
MRDEPKVPARPRRKTWSWFRKYNGFPYHPKWPMVAKRARVRTETVVVIVLLLEDAANRGSPRGNVEEFKFAECASHFKWRERTVRRVWDVLVEIG